MSRQLYFRGIINNELFYNVDEYNARIKQLIEEDSDIKCFTQTSTEPLINENDKIGEDGAPQGYKVISDTPIYKEPEQVPELESIEEVKNKFYGLDNLFATLELYINAYATDTVKYTKNNPIENVRNYLDEYIRSIIFKKHELTEKYLSEFSSITNQFEANLSNDNTELISYDEEYLRINNYNKEIAFWNEYMEAIKALQSWVEKQNG